MPERSFKRNLINTGEVASFIVKTKKKEEYDEVIEEIVKKLAKMIYM